MSYLTAKKQEIGKEISEKGCFTRLKEIAGASLSEIEIRLGFRHGRLSQGAYIVQACELPRFEGKYERQTRGLPRFHVIRDEFELIGYTNVPSDSFMTERNERKEYDKSKSDAIYGPHDHNKLKILVQSAWQISGPDSLVKVKAVETLSNETYPESKNRISQYYIKVPLRCKVIAFVEPNQRFSLR